MTKNFHELSGKEVEQLLKAGTKRIIEEAHADGQPTAHGGDKGVYLLYPDGHKEYVELYEDDTK